MSDPYRVRVSGPLAPFAHGFADELGQLGYTSLSAGLQMHLMAHVDRWMAAQQLRPADLTGPVVERFLAHRRRAGYTMHCSMRGLTPLVAYLRSVGVAIPPAAVMVVPGGEIVERYRRYLLNERCVVPSTARSYLDVLAPFIDTYANRGWGELTAGEVTTFIVAECPRRSTRMSKELATAMRSFLRFLHVSGEIRSSLCGAVPKVAGWKQTALPKRLEREQVRALLDSCDRSTPVGRRD